MDRRRNHAVEAATCIASQGHAIRCVIDPGGDIVAVQGHIVLVELHKFHSRHEAAFSRSGQDGYDENRRNWSREYTQFLYPETTHTASSCFTVSDIADDPTFPKLDRKSRNSY